MCMISCVLTKEFGVIASDSARNENGNLSYEFPKVYFAGKYLITAIGATPYFSKINKEKFTLDFASLSVYLEDYFKEMKPKVEETLKELNPESYEQYGNLCAFVLGVHNGKPTLMNFNSYSNFKPKYLFSDGAPKFPTIYHPEKQEMFDEVKQYMEKKVHKLEKKNTVLSPGLLGEILVRGIYKKADIEFEKEQKKYSGGVPTVAVLYKDGRAVSLSNVNIIV